jgi:hypothetical protein
MLRRHRREAAATAAEKIAGQGLKADERIQINCGTDAQWQQF